MAIKGETDINNRKHKEKLNNIIYLKLNISITLNEIGLNRLIERQTLRINKKFNYMYSTENS